jgi:hemolysin activation/secretion protein
VLTHTHQLSKYLFFVAGMALSQIVYGLPSVDSQKPEDRPFPQGQTPAPSLKTPDTNTGTTHASDTLDLVFLRKIHLTGNTVFNQTDLAGILTKYQGRTVSADDLRQLRQDLTVHYINNGFINSGAVIPEQDLNNGELQVQIIEGRLSDLQISGLEHLREFYLAPRMAAGLKDQPLNIKKLQENLQFLQQSTLIKRINAELSPGLKRGEAILRAQVEEAFPYYVTFGGNNNGVPGVGAERFEMWAGHRNLFGLGDPLNANFSVSEGQTQYAFDYAIPINRYDTSFTATYQFSEANVVEKPFDTLNIFNTAETIGIGISQPIWRSLENQVTLNLNAEHRHSKAFLDPLSTSSDFQQPFDFARGSDEGVSNINVLRFSQDWLSRTDRHVIALRSVFNMGLDVLDATMHPVGQKRDEFGKKPDGRYFFWLGQGQWVQRLGESGTELHVQSNLQLAGEALLSLEQYAVGGMNSVRGYRKNQIVSDNGITGSLELRIPVLEKTLGNGVLRLAPFFDVGHAWFHDIEGTPPNTLYSAGLGFHLDPVKQCHIEFYWAHPFQNIETSTNNIQDIGLHFAINISPFAGQ